MNFSLGKIKSSLKPVFLVIYQFFKLVPIWKLIKKILSFIFSYKMGDYIKRTSMNSADLFNSIRKKTGDDKLLGIIVFLFLVILIGFGLSLG